MKQARGALMVALVLSGTRTVGAEPCVPRASLAGDAAEVARVAAELQRLGVAVDRATSEPSSRCEVAAAVEPDHGGGISVAVRDASRRSEGRVLSDATLAAVWIDSWVHDDDLGPPPSEPVVRAPGTTVAAIGAGAPVIAGERVAFGAGYEEAWTDDGSAWSGFAAGACVRTGAFCLGVRVRYARQQVTANLTSAARTDESALATASWSHALGRMQVAPEIGIGVGRLSTDRVDGCAPAPLANPPTCDPSTDPTCPPTTPPPQPCTVSPDGTASGPVYVGDGFGQTTYTPRGEAALRLAVPLFEHVWLEGHASVTLAPFGHEASYLPPPPVNTTGSTAPFTPQQLALPGDPQTAVQLGIGLTVTAP